MISKNSGVAMLRLIVKGVPCIQTVHIEPCHSSFASQVATIEIVELQITVFAARPTPQPATTGSFKIAMITRNKGFLNDVKLWFSVPCKPEIMTEALSLVVHFSVDYLTV